MTIDSVLLRCGSCHTVNRVPVSRLNEKSKCGKCRGLLDFPRSPVEVTDSNFTREVLEWPGVVLLFFWATWCAHCRGMMLMLEDLARNKAGIIKAGMINTEQSLILARRFDVMSVPRLTLYRNGKMLDELNGAVSKSQLEEWIEYALRRP